MIRGRSRLLALTLALVACTTPSPPDETNGPASPSAAGPSTVASGSGSNALIDPGQPYTATDILEAMRTSRRPGGVPDEIETDAVAEAVADAVWTFDGRPWDAMAIGGTCGLATCTLDVVGTREDATGEDLWTFAVTPDGTRSEVTASSLGATPDELTAALDGLTRSLVPSELLDGLLLTSTRWLPPPDNGAFALGYRSGEEEGSCEVDIVIDAIDRRIVSAGDPC